MLVLLGMLLALVGNETCASGQVNLRGSWKYQDNSSYNESVDQSYSLSGGHQVDLTDLVGYRLDLRYNRRESDKKDDTKNLVTQDFAPSLGFWVTNDFFRLDVNGQGNKNMSSTANNRSSWSLRTSAANVITRRFWPNLSVSLQQQASFDDGDPRLSNAERAGADLSLDWDLELVNLRYSKGWSENIDKVSQAETSANRQSLSWDVSRDFLDKRASMAFSQQYDIQESRGEVPAVGGMAYPKIDAPALEVMVWSGAGVVKPPSNPGGVWNQKSALTDDILSDGVTDVSANDDFDLMLRVDGQQVDIVYLYTDADLGSPGIAGWELYSTNDDFADPPTWTAEANPAVSYDQGRRCFVVNVGNMSGRKYLRLFHDAMPVTLSFAEVAAHQGVATTSVYVSESEGESLKTSFNLGFRISPGLNFSYSLALQSQENSSSAQPGEVRENKGKSQSASLAWNPKRFFSSCNFNVSESVNNNWQQPEGMARGYSFSGSMAPLPALHVNLGFGLSQGFTDSLKTSTGKNFNLSSSAILYSDLTSDFSWSIQQSKDEQTGATSETMNSGLGFTLRPTPRLTVGLSGRYATSESSSAASQAPDNYSSDLSTSWRLSEMLSVSLASSGSWIGALKNYGAGLGFSLAPTSKTRMTFSYSYSWATGGTRSDSYSTSWSWALSRSLSLRATGNYQESGQQKPWSIQGSLDANFFGK